MRGSCAARGGSLKPALRGAILCLRPARKGGRSRISSALEVHEWLRRERPDVLPRLYEPHIRDLVTPGAARSPANIRANAFPIFSPAPGPAFRYMRYWIERGQEMAGAPLDSDQIEVLDQLDAALEDPRHAVHFLLEEGDMLFLDNTIIAHDREAYLAEPDAPRWLCRLWLETHPGPTSERGFEA